MTVPTAVSGRTGSAPREPGPSCDGAIPWALSSVRDAEPSSAVPRRPRRTPPLPPVGANARLPMPGARTVVKRQSRDGRLRVVDCNSLLVVATPHLCRVGSPVLRRKRVNDVVRAEFHGPASGNGAGISGSAFRLRDFGTPGADSIRSPRAAQSRIGTNYRRCRSSAHERLIALG